MDTYLFDNNAVFYISKKTALIFSCSAIFVAFLTVFILSLIVSDFKNKYKNIFVYVSLSVISLDFAIAVENNAYDIPIYSLAFFFLCLSPVYTVSRPKKQVGEKERELVRLIDSKIKAPFQKTLDKELCSEQNIINGEKPPQSNIFSDINVSHIKSVIDRLSFYELSLNDKKLVRELEMNLNKLNQGDYDYDLKDKINDGLGAILKIMSKYGA